MTHAYGIAGSKEEGALHLRRNYRPDVTGPVENKISDPGTLLHPFPVCIGASPIRLRPFTTHQGEAG